jgi:hypothetical protein
MDEQPTEPVIDEQPAPATQDRIDACERAISYTLAVVCHFMGRSHGVDGEIVARDLASAFLGSLHEPRPALQRAAEVIALHAVEYACVMDRERKHLPAAH